jgi:N-hydroxyarylamine O-acetyltransferase
MIPAIDLDAYFARIGHPGAAKPTLETLRELVLLQPQAIPFENLNQLLSLPVLLDPASLERKLLHEGRGGTCSELNLLFKYVLEAIGFEVHGLAARVVWNRPPDVVTQRSHALLNVKLDGEDYIIDSAFGGLTCTGVLRLEPDVEQATPHGPFRLLREPAGYFRLQIRIRDEWMSLYRFDLHEQFHPDYEITSYFNSTHPRSQFKSNLFAGRTDAGRRLVLHNSKFTIHHVGGPSETRILTSASELREVLERDFLLKLPASPELETVLARYTTGLPEVFTPLTTGRPG